MNETLLGLLDRSPVPKRRVIFDYAVSCLGKDISPIQNELACMESVETIMGAATGKKIGAGASTYWGQVLLDKQSFPHFGWRFVKIKESQARPGDLVISASGYGGSRTVSNGHVGIVGENEQIMSNNSKTFKWDAHYTFATWRQRYVVEGRFPMNFYRVIK
jgi:hypothetical protein